MNTKQKLTIKEALNALKDQSLDKVQTLLESLLDIPKSLDEPIVVTKDTSRYIRGFISNKVRRGHYFTRNQLRNIYGESDLFKTIYEKDKDFIEAISNALGIYFHKHKNFKGIHEYGVAMGYEIIP